MSSISLRWIKSTDPMVMKTNLKGDKVLLPQDLLNDLQNDLNKGSPLTFEMKNSRTGMKFYGGVLEFSAPSGYIVLPDYISQALDMKETDLIILRKSILPKGTFAKLQPLQTNYLEIYDFRAALESFLRSNFTTLTKGGVITLMQQGNQFDILVNELLPEDAVCIIDTELEVDIVPPEGVIIPQPIDPVDLKMDSNYHGSIKKGEFVYYRFPFNQKSTFSISLNILSGDADLFISLIYKKPSSIDNNWYNVDKGSKKTIIDHFKVLSDHPDTQEYFIGVEGYEKETTYQIMVQLSEPQIEKKESNVVLDNGPDDHKRCTNCFQWIPNRTFDMHFAFCSRNNEVCNICNKAVQKSQKATHYHCEFCAQLLKPDEKEKHFHRKHHSIKCPCGMDFDIDLMQEHRLKFCRERMITCQYCMNYVRAGPPSKNFGYSVSEHEEYCGSRTIECVACKKSVQLRDLKIHQKIHEYHNKDKPIPFKRCKNDCCTEEEDKQNPLGLCSRCYGPFWSPSDDPGHQKLIQRIVGRYHNQLTNGCQAKECKNEYCKSNGLSQYYLNPIDANTSALLSYKLLQQSALFKKKSGSKYYFCVDDITSRRMNMALQLSKMGYQLEWCINSLKESRDDIMAAANWLTLKAPHQS